MKQKIILTTFFLTILSLSVFVSATMTSKQNGNYEVSIGLSKGWNIVAGTALEQGISSDSEIKLSDIKAMWYYSPVLKKYYQIYPNNELDDLSVEEGRQLDEDVILTSAMWIYTDKAGTLKYDTLEDYPLLENRQLFGGYNFMTITPDMDGNSINEIKGECNIIESYGFDTSSQKWVSLSQNNKLDTNSAGMGVLLKISNDCTLRVVEPSANPPGLPTNNPSGGCTDSDGGIDLSVKGTLTLITGDRTTTASDNCAYDNTPDDPTSVRYIENETCSAGNNCYIQELSCNYGGEDYSQSFACPNGCKNGACI